MRMERACIARESSVGAMASTMRCRWFDCTEKCTTRAPPRSRRPSRARVMTAKAAGERRFGSPGTVRNVTAAVFIAPRMVATPPSTGADGKPVPASAQVQKRTPQELEALRQVVINALGLKPAVGQTLDSVVSLQETEFQAADPRAAQIEAVAGETKLQSYSEIASRWAAVGGAALVLLIFWRMLKREKPEPVPIEVLSLSPDTSMPRAMQANGPVTPEVLNELIKQKPANVGMALRDWVSAGNAPTGKN